MFTDFSQVTATMNILTNFSESGIKDLRYFVFTNSLHERHEFPFSDENCRDQ